MNLLPNGAWRVANKKQTHMNNLRNNVQLVGNIGKAPEIISLESGKKMAKFSLATKEFFKDSKGELQTETQWHSLVAWGRQAEIIEQYLKPGQKITVEGKLMNRTYETKAGEKRTKSEIHIQKMLMLMKSKMNSEKSN
jgi:single-strand DNA-binding protein